MAAEEQTAEERTATHDGSSQTRPPFVLVRAGLVERNFFLLRHAITAALEDNCFGIAKGAAYSFLLSLFPVLTILTSLLLQVKAGSVLQVLAHFFGQIVPPGTEELVLSRLRERGVKPVSVSIVSSVVALWIGSGAMITLMEGFEAAYRIPAKRPFLQQRAMAMFLVFVTALPAVIASVLILSGDRLEIALLDRTHVGYLSAPTRLAWRFGRYAVAISTTTFVTGLLYYFGTNHRSESDRLHRAAKGRFWRVWPGAFLATALWLLSTGGFAWYVHHLAHYNLFYGSIGAVVILTIWLYLIACVALIGCEFNAERERSNLLPPVY